jgi:ketosteroid isomerase-like protein
VDEQEIRDLIRNMNDAWLTGPVEEIPARLDACFHDDIVIRGADLTVSGRGKAACIQSYVDFVSEAAIRECTLEDPEIDLAGDTAAAVYSWEMTYDLDGQEYSEAGADLLMLARSGGRWLVTWRVMLPSVGQD